MAPVKAMGELVRKPSPIRALIQSQPTESMTSPAGILENGDVWPSIDGTLIWAPVTKSGAVWTSTLLTLQRIPK